MRKSNWQGAGVASWMSVGKPMSSGMTTSESLANAGLGWNVRLGNLFTDDLPVPGFKAVVREDTRAPLGVVTDDYKVIQNIEVAAFIDAVAAGGGAKVEVAGAFDGGADVFFAIRMDGDMLIGGKDPVEQHLIVANNHVGLRAFRAVPVPLRRKCTNALRGSLRKYKFDGITIRHVGDVQERMDEACRVLSEARRQYGLIAEVFNSMAARVMSDQQIRAFAEQLIPDLEEGASDRRIQTVKDARESIVSKAQGAGIGLDEPGIRGTAWGVYNAVVEDFDFGRNYRSDESRAKAIMFDAALKSRALELLTV